MMEQVVNKVSKGYNLSSTFIKTMDSTSISQLLASTRPCRHPVRRDGGKAGAENREPNRGQKRSADGQVGGGGSRLPTKGAASGLQEYPPA